MCKNTLCIPRFLLQVSLILSSDTYRLPVFGFQDKRNRAACELKINLIFYFFYFRIRPANCSLVDNQLVLFFYILLSQILVNL